MSKASSNVTTVKCDKFDCDKEYVYVGNESSFLLGEGWDQIAINRGEYDFCPEHAKELENFVFGPEDTNPTVKFRYNDEIPGPDPYSETQ